MQLKLSSYMSEQMVDFCSWRQKINQQQTCEFVGHRILEALQLLRISFFFLKKHTFEANFPCVLAEKIASYSWKSKVNADENHFDWKMFSEQTKERPKLHLSIS